MPAEIRDQRLGALWEATDRLLADVSVAGVLAHKLGPLAANRARRAGEPVPEPFALEERAATLALLTSTPLIERVRASCDGQLVLVKGPEVARLYPGGARRFSDVDLLAPDADAVQRALRGCGFVEVPDPGMENVDEHHHLVPLRWPTIWLKVEVHISPNWPPHVAPPPLEEILEAAVPSSIEIEGIDAPTPLHHSLILASHAWRHEPLQTLRDLVDIAAVSAGVDEGELERTARRWGLGRVWETTRRALEAILFDGRSTVPLRSWARHLEAVRERTILESHVQRLVHGYWGLPPHRAAVETARGVRTLVAPVPGETWSDKLARARRATRNPSAPVTGRDARTTPRADDAEQR